MGLIRGSRPSSPRRRRRFSLNALAIQLSAFALSSTLVALLVVAGSQAAFVEESKALAEYAPIVSTGEEQAPRTARSSRPPAPAPPQPAAPPVEQPVDGPAAPAEEPAAPPAEVPAARPADPVAAIELTDTDAGSAMFSDGTTLAPGDPLDRCIEVTYDGIEDPLPVRLYAASVAGDLAPYLDLTIELGTADEEALGTCGGFVRSRTVYSGDLADFATTHAGYGTGLETWRTEGARDARTFRFRVAVRDEPEAAGRSVSFGFTWETRED